MRKIRRINKGTIEQLIMFLLLWLGKDGGLHVWPTKKVFQLYALLKCLKTIANTLGRTNELKNRLEFGTSNHNFSTGNLTHSPLPQPFSPRAPPRSSP